MLGKRGVEARITNDGYYRSFDEQAKLYATYKNGGPKANPPGGSAHNFGMAIDIALIRGKERLEYKPNLALWSEVGKVAEQAGVRWLGDKDSPHFQHPQTPCFDEMIRRYHNGTDVLGP